MEKKNPKRTTAVSLYRGSIFIKKECSTLEHFFDAADAGLQFMGITASEESGYEAADLSGAVISITNCLSSLLSVARKEFENVALLDLRHPGIDEACRRAEEAARAAEAA